jgi:phosphatidylglycerol:prolipoprotein diacylglycerol transferase
LRKKPHKDGFIAGLYVLLYSVGRFVVSFFRADSLMLGNLRAAQVISLILVIVVGFWIIKGRFWVVRQNN